MPAIAGEMLHKKLAEIMPKKRPSVSGLGVVTVKPERSQTLEDLVREINPHIDEVIKERSKQLGGRKINPSTRKENKEVLSGKKKKMLRQVKISFNVPQ